MRTAKWWNWVLLSGSMVAVNLAVSLTDNHVAIHQFVIRDWTAELFGIACGAVALAAIATWH